MDEFAVLTEHKGPYELSTDRSRIDFEVVHDFLTNSYWAKGISRADVERSARHSLIVGVYFEGSQVGYARVVSDFTQFAYLADVFVLEEHRGNGLASWLGSFLLEHPELTPIRRWLLATLDAHELYRKLGFDSLPNPSRFMVRMDEDSIAKRNARELIVKHCR
ncbi:GNAT family N-acetyltransferase [Natronoglycomyces albus]|uniref:GNAT family N-acetyltransferase n=1 Tax=Natronoglycomyces albus TaxID=2811108 RepID=A0A895XRC3_9ACTN|nr:GNAT family N-acetyltransferase [Natronoglycomyces albus]QSB05116.1 GNAT family N-acetyltransferase [Natronoglycomyces albus]